MVCGVMEGLAQTAIGCNEDLLGMVSNGNYYLTADLEVEGWVPLATFSGTLDGRGHSIMLPEGRLDAEGRGGLFSSTNGAEIRNLVVGGKFYGIQNASGGIVAQATNTNFINCEAETVLVTGYDDILLGGLVGVMDGGSMVNCSSRGFLEGYLLGGLAGSTRNDAVIKNCYSYSTFITRSKTSESQVGGLVHTNAGILENNYVALGRDGFFTPSIGQLNQMYGIRGFAILRYGSFITWADGAKMSSTLVSNDRLLSMNHFGQIASNTLDAYNNSQGTPIRYAHEFYGSGYNYGDVIYISGLPCLVFNIHDNGIGGVAAPAYEDLAQYQFTCWGNDVLSAYYQQSSCRKVEYEYALCHDGVTAYGDATPLIPEEYQQNAGKFYSFNLRDNDPNLRDIVHVFKLFIETNLKYNYSVKQLAYFNTGQIKRCYYPIDKNCLDVNTGNPAENSCRYYNPGTPYVFGSFGPLIYHESQSTDFALVDTLNAWVKLQNNDLYAPWAVPNTTLINNNMPVLGYRFHNGSEIVDCAIERGWRFLHKALRYAEINELSSEQTIRGNNLAYYDNREDINANNVTTPWGSGLYITENASLKGNYALNGNVCVTFDNSDASGFAGEAYDWHCFSPSLSNAPLGINYVGYTNGGASGNPSAVSFNQADGYFPTNSPYTGWDFYFYHEPTCGWLNFKRKTGDHYNPWNGQKINYTNESNLIQGKGYLAAVKEKTGLLAYGRLNNGDIPISLSKQGEYWDGYNLVGNPYHAYLDFNAFCDDNETVMTQRAYAILDADHQGYISYCPEASDNPVYAPRYLHPHQGFFIQTNTDNSQATFKSGQTVVTPASTFREEPVRYPLVNLWVRDDEGRKDYATVELDRPRQGGVTKLKGLKSGKAEISISHQALEYSIAFLTERPETIPVHLKVDNDGTYTLAWGILHAEIPCLHLIDNLTGNDVDCLTQTSYSFHAGKNDSSSRFKLVFSNTELEEDTDFGASGRTDFAYHSNQGWVVTRQGLLELCDLQGRVLWTQTVDAPYGKFHLPQVAQGVYLLRLRSPQGVWVQKIIL